MTAPASGTRHAKAPMLLAGALAVIAVIVASVLVAGRGGSGKPTAQQPQQIARPDLGFSLELPSTWIVDVDRTPGSIFFAHAAPPRSSARIFRGQTEQPLDQNMVNVVEGLRQQGAYDFSQHAVQIGDLAGIRLDYLATDGPDGALQTHSSYRVKKANAVFSLSLATTDPNADNQVLAGIASSFHLL